MTHATKGPWEWGGTPDDLRLQTVDRGKQFVMTFSKNSPRFQTDGRMIDAANLLKFEVGNPAVTGHRVARKARSVYRYNVSGVDHPDAHLIAAAPDMLEALESIERLYISILTGKSDLNDTETLVLIGKKAKAAIAKTRGKS